MQVSAEKNMVCTIRVLYEERVCGGKEEPIDCELSSKVSTSSYWVYRWATVISRAKDLQWKGTGERSHPTSV